MGVCKVAHAALCVRRGAFAPAVMITVCHAAPILLGGCIRVSSAHLSLLMHVRKTNRRTHAPSYFVDVMVVDGVQTCAWCAANTQPHMRTTHSPQVFSYFVDVMVVEYVGQPDRFKLLPKGGAKAGDGSSVTGPSNMIICMEYCDAGKGWSVTARKAVCL